MVIKKDLWIIVVSSVALFLLLNLITSYYFELPLSYTLIVGKSSFGTISLFIQGQNGTIIIDHPMNYSYGPYTVIDFASLDLDLNVSADFVATEWNYSLYDARHGVYVSEDVAFVPNGTFSPRRWSNRLDVFAIGDDSKSAAASVSFFINVENSPPVIDAIDDPIQVCENTALNYLFNASDADEDSLINSIYPNQDFFLTELEIIDYNITSLRLFTHIGLDYGDVGEHYRNITVYDNFDKECCTHTVEATIEVIEVNDEPGGENIDIGTQTVYFNGTGKSLEYQWEVTDEEDGDSLDGNLSFNISGNFDLFGINGTGFMNYTPIAEHNGTYEVTVCANDNDLSSIHQNISICTGQQATSNFVCEDFTLVVTDVNRAPNITVYSPGNLSFSVYGDTPTLFKANATDPDGADPDIIWYVEGAESRREVGTNSSSFWHTFDCDFSGTRTVLVNATDGDLEDTVSWTVEVLYMACPPGGPQDPPPSDGGGGGGGSGSGSSACYENWFCQGWSVCFNVEEALSSGDLNLGDYSYLREVCLQNQYLGTSCGFQEELCSDLKSCNNTFPVIAIPSEKRSCYYTADPSCFDEILNCHGGGCEVLIDCGGPCLACPTCTDGIRNQGESGIDCGGPCPVACQYEEPKMKINFFWMWLLLLLVIILLFIIYKVLKIFGYLPADEEKEKKLERRVRRKFRSRMGKVRRSSQNR
jgi:hypothetical protein